MSRPPPPAVRFAISTFGSGTDIFAWTKKKPSGSFRACFSAFRIHYSLATTLCAAINMSISTGKAIVYYLYDHGIVGTDRIHLDTLIFLVKAPFYNDLLVQIDKCV